MNQLLQIEDTSSKSQTSERYRSVSDFDSECSSASSCHITRNHPSVKTLTICQDFEENMVCTKGRECRCAHETMASKEPLGNRWGKFHLLSEYPELVICHYQVKRANSLLFP